MEVIINETSGTDVEEWMQLDKNDWRWIKICGESWIIMWMIGAADPIGLDFRDSWISCHSFYHLFELHIDGLLEAIVYICSVESYFSFGY